MLDQYAYSVASSGLFQRVLEDPRLAYAEAYGTYDELTFNPVGPTFNDGRLNPFGNRIIREAMNRLIGRDSIAQQIFGGLARGKWLPLSHVDAGYQRYAPTIRFPTWHRRRLAPLNGKATPKEADRRMLRGHERLPGGCDENRVSGCCFRLVHDHR